MTPVPVEERPDHPERLDEAVRLRRGRRERWRREGERSVGQNLAMIGVLGWTIVTPTLIGSTNRTCRFPASGSRTRLHAFFACNAVCSF